MKKRAINILVNLDLIIACISLVTLTVLTFVGVITRYAFHSPISWQGEIQILCYIWLVYFGLSTVVRYGNHISIDIIVDALPEKTAKVVRVLDLVIFMVVLLFTAYQGSMLVKQLFVTNRISGVLDLPYWIFYFPMPVGCVLTMVNCIGELVYKKRYGRDLPTKHEFDTGGGEG